MIRFCNSCHQSSAKVRFPSASATRCTKCTDALKAARHERLAALRPSPIAVEPDRDADPDRSADHLAWIRLQCCAVKNIACNGPIEAHHVRTAANSGTGKKPGDQFVIPLCSRHHQEYHSVGVATFESRHHVLVLELAEQMARLSPHLKQRAEA